MHNCPKQVMVRFRNQRLSRSSCTHGGLGRGLAELFVVQPQTGTLRLSRSGSFVKWDSCGPQASDMAHRNPGYVEITCPDTSAFHSFPHCEFVTTMQLLAAAHDRCARGEMTKTDFKDLEIMSGFNYNPYSVVMSRDLQPDVNPVVMATYDWVHTVLQHGVFTVEVEALVAKTGVAREELRSYLADTTWCFPHHQRVKSRQLHRVFDIRRAGDSDAVFMIRASCSELLGMYGMLRFFFAVKFADQDEFKQELESFNAICEVIDLLLFCKRGLLGVDDAATRLDAALQRHLRAHTAVYGDEWVRPKHHWLLDVPGQLRRDGLVLDAFIIERTHLRIKSHAQEVDNTRAYEYSVLASFLTVVVRGDGSDDSMCHGLIGRTASLPGACVSIRVADKMRVWGSVEISVDDVVVRARSAARVLACAAQHGELFLFVLPLQTFSVITEHCDLCKLQQEVAVWRANDVVHATAWRERPDGSFCIVRQ